jgi:plasmid stabilization system protein ParE
VLDHILLLAAEVALQEIYEFLEERGNGSGERFLDALNEGLAQLGTFPWSGSHFHRQYRRLLISGHRYGLIYSIEGRRVVVARIIDLRQDLEAIRRSLG